MFNLNSYQPSEGTYMTLPIQRTNAVLNVERFLLDLCTPLKYPDVPKSVREEAHRLLKHYPTCFDMMYLDESFEPVEKNH